MLQANAEELAVVHGKGKMTKIDRYKWTMRDSPGRFAMLNKRDLQVDHDYQREKKEITIQAVAQDFSWIAFGALCVAHRNGEFWVIDGQNRLLGAMKRADIETVPCMIYETSNKVAEAQGFIDVNCNRKSVPMLAKWKAMLMAGDVTAYKVKNLLQTTGHVIKPGSTELGAVGCVHSLYKYSQSDFETLQRVWPLIVEVCGTETIQQRFLFAVMYVESVLSTMGETLTSRRFRKKMNAAGIKSIMESINSAAAFRGQAGQKACGEGLVKILNSGVHADNKIKISFD